ncbi:putative F-box protein At2g02030 [Cannabis sativa]|nr:putative F-box protein At2g02030 [Cannabis sativa]XP_030502020.2 putative F-box protein At2g02030 [Cannabis sativa]
MIMAKRMSFCDLPEEIIEKIMLWVPADSLVQSKVVNKFWYSLISGLINDPKFVSDHLLIAKNQSSASLLFKWPSHHVDHRLIAYKLLTVNYDDRGEDDPLMSVSEPLSIHLPELIGDESSWHCSYHCDGLILLVSDVGRMALCNPALKEFMFLPQPRNFIIEGPPRYPNGVVEFGFDSANNDYKCVVIWCHNKCKVEVYTMSSNSWREINMPQDIVDIITSNVLGNPLYWEGVCYWLGHDLDNYYYRVILSFNLSNEEFHLIRLPHFKSWDLTCYRIEFVVWNDSVALYWRDDRKNILRLFTMDVAEEGSDYSWTNYECVGPVGKIWFEQPIWKNDEILMEVKKDGHKELVSFNILTQKVRNVVCCDQDFSRDLRSRQFFFVKSLVSLRRR